MNNEIIYGSSDDLIEIDGLFCDEHNCYGHEKPINIRASDGTKATIFYDGEWKIDVKEQGDKFQQLIKAVGEDNSHAEPFKLCSSYSDILVLNEGVEWIKIGTKTYKAD